MLRNVKGITGYSLEATDGKIGRCADFLFDDELWTVRYMVAETGNWLIGRRVLVSPISLGEPDWASRILPVRLTRKQIEDAPPLEEHAPVSRRYETRFHRHYGWPYYWGAGGIWGVNAYPNPLYDQGAMETLAEAKGVRDAQESRDSEDSYVRSVSEVTGYRIQATDGEIGHVEDFVLDDESWILRYMVIDTRNWLPGKKVLIAPSWIESIDWSQQRVEVSMSRKEIRNAPEFDPDAPVNRRYETVLYDFHGKPRYWESSEPVR